jgi:hypothetical protein
MKTKNDSMGTLKLKLDVTPQNIEYLKSLFLKPENKTSNFIEVGTMLFNGKPVEKSVDDLPTVATLRTKYGSLRDGDISLARSNDKYVYIGVVTNFTENMIYVKNAIYVFVNESTNNIGIQCLDTYSFLIQDLCGIAKNQ